jgi:hypothetical protein
LIIPNDDDKTFVKIKYLSKLGDLFKIVDFTLEEVFLFFLNKNLNILLKGIKQKYKTS